MMNQMPDKINVLTAILHVKEAARLLETSNLDVSQALYKVALALIEKEQISNGDIAVALDAKSQLESKING